jgi:formamidopyrimidine-DNA glycosylase
VPELPEAERARAQIERALGRTVAAVDDSDTYVCRPHSPGELAAALVGRTLTGAGRRGKFLWVETDGPVLGLHLGMAGRIALDEPAHERWDRFALEFTDGGRLALHDRRRLGRAVLEPDHSRLGPDAAGVGAAEFARRVGAGSAPVKARLMDQSRISGIGNLLADEILWRARLSPERRELSRTELDRLHRHVRAAVDDAVRLGGAHTGRFVEHRERGGRCPICGSELARATIGGRTTYWCPKHQPSG